MQFVHSMLQVYYVDYLLPCFITRKVYRKLVVGILLVRKEESV